jgi:RHS repeat-associated protein
LFTGRRVDILDNGSLKIQYNRNRYYDYYTGRWITHDPLGYVDGVNLYEYVTSKPIIAGDPAGLTKCDGGNWWVAGSSTTFSLAVVNVKKALLKLVCERSTLFGEWTYCCDGVTFYQKVWRIPTAHLEISDISGGAGLGVGHLLVTGEISGAQDPTTLAGAGLSGPGVSVTALLVGVSFGGKMPGAGFVSGVGASASLSIAGAAFTTVLTHGYDLEEEELDASFNKLIKICCCKKHFQLTLGAPWESTPLQAKPVPHPKGFSTDEH